MQKTRVLFVLPQLDAGGSERVVFDLARSLDPGKFEVFVAAFKAGVLVEPLRAICQDVFIIEKKQGLDISAMVKVANIVKKYGIDVVNAHHYMPCFYSFLGTKVHGKKLIYTEHSVPEVENLANCFHGKVFHWMLYGMDGVVGVSKAITERFRGRYSRHTQKIHQIVNGVDIEKFRAKGTRESIRSTWRLTDDHFVVGTVANFRKVKNHVCLVRAAGRLKDTHPQLRLFFVGTGFAGDAENSEHQVRTLIHELGLQDRVILTGYRDNIPELLAAFDAFCLPSFSEGLPVSVLEAMAAGVLVIGSDVAGISEVVSHRKTGLLFPVDDDERLALLLKEQMADPRNSAILAANGLRFVDKDHSSKRWVQQYEDFFINGAAVGHRAKV
ncbi:MAG: hypothetical protein A2X81_08235 [Desulfobacterales bacterium GWB2_56_26]|nr:MAG: hypothetical protein A2X81_08235 [Desulfobacterales bacterium GWB2_56_26]